MDVLDLSFFRWDVLGLYQAGLGFSIWLTVVATLGGIALGTVLALMRLSGRKAPLKYRCSLRPTPCARSRW